MSDLKIITAQMSISQKLAMSWAFEMGSWGLRVYFPETLSFDMISGWTGIKSTPATSVLTHGPFLFSIATPHTVLTGATKNQ